MGSSNERQLLWEGAEDQEERSSCEFLPTAAAGAASEISMNANTLSGLSAMDGIFMFDLSHFVTCFQLHSNWGMSAKECWRHHVVINLVYLDVTRKKVCPLLTFQFLFFFIFFQTVSFPICTMCWD